MPAATQGTDALRRGRAAFTALQWEDAYSALRHADQEQALGTRDLELLARSSSMTARDDEAFRYLERNYKLCMSEGDELRAAGAAFWLGFRLASLGERARSQGWLSRAAEIADRLGNSVVSGYLELPRIHHLLHTGDTAGASDAAARAQAIGDRFSDPDLSALARQLGGRALLEHGDIAGGMGLLDEAMLIATTAPISELSKGLVYCSVVGCCQRVFAVDRAREWSDVLDTWCRTQTQLGIFDGTCRVHRAELLRLRGAWDEALAEARHVASAANSDRAERALAHYEEAEILRLRGDEDAAAEAYERASELGADPQPGLALLRLAQGHLQTASSSIGRSVATARDPLTRASFLPAHVEILVAAGDLALAAAATRDLAGLAVIYGSPLLTALAAHTDGLVALASGQPTRAIEAFQQALELWRSLDAPYAAARTRTAIAAAYRALGDAEGSRLETAAARAMFTALGAANDLRILNDLESPDIPDRAPRGILSSRELQVLRNAATGASNKEIATALGLSVRTVDRHMSAILLKLSVPSRAGATAFAYEHGLIES